MGRVFELKPVARSTLHSGREAMFQISAAVFLTAVRKRCMPANIARRHRYLLPGCLEVHVWNRLPVDTPLRLEWRPDQFKRRN